MACAFQGEKRAVRLSGAIKISENPLALRKHKATHIT